MYMAQRSAILMCPLWASILLPTWGCFLISPIYSFLTRSSDVIVTSFLLAVPTRTPFIPSLFLSCLLQLAKS
ncbi:hypothetical protein BJV77DRAFT_1046045, partial [Russula vinacea]